MPELPEVETIKNQLLEANLVGKRINEANLYWPKTLVFPTLAQFKQKIALQTIHDIKRKGKQLIFCLDDFDLVIHLRMSGQFQIKKHLPKTLLHERAYLKVGQKFLIFVDSRKFGTWNLVKDYRSFLSHLGQEPLSKNFDSSVFSNKLKKSNRPIKTLLLDQTLIAGVGNIYADETLWQAQILPTRSASSISNDEARLIIKSLKEVLKKAIQNNGSSLGKGKANYRALDEIHGKYQYQFNVYQKKDLPCIVCHNPIEKIKLNGRGTHFCSSCQK